MRRVFLLSLAMLLPLGALSFQKPPQQPTAASTTANTKQETTQNQPAKSFWQRTRTDPLALYTLALAVFTGLLFAVSIFQGILLLRADNTARIAANAAAESARVATDTLHLGHRAHLHLATWTIDNFQPNLVPVVRLEVLNSGQTSAHFVGIRWAYDDTGPPPPTPEYREPIKSKHGVGRPSDKAIAEMSFKFTGPLSQETFEAVASFKRGVYVWGEIIYKDIFGTEHRTGFGFGLWIARGAQGGWDSFPINKPGYNYAD